jgi:hypothetical protein
MLISSICNQSSFGTVCRRCNDKLIAPNWSTYVSERHIRHFWICDGCGQHFETSDRLQFSCIVRGSSQETVFLIAGCVKTPSGGNI